MGADGRGTERHGADQRGVGHGAAGERARKRFGAPANWNCRDIKLTVSRVAFDQLGPERAKALNAVDTRLKLPADQVDAVIAAGHDALRANPTFREFLKGIAVPGAPPSAVPEPAEPPSVPVAEALPEISRSAFAPQ